MFCRDAWIILFGHSVLTLIQVLTVLGFLGHLSVRVGLQPMELLDQGSSVTILKSNFFFQLDLLLL